MPPLRITVVQENRALYIHGTSLVNCGWHPKTGSLASITFAPSIVRKLSNLELCYNLRERINSGRTIKNIGFPVRRRTIKLVLRRFTFSITLSVIVVGSAGIGRMASTLAQDKAAQDASAKEKPAQDKATKEKPAQPNKTKVENLAQSKVVTAEGVAESVVLYNGTREGLAQVRRTGVERGRITRTLLDGKLEESTYERTFIRGEKLIKDRVRFEQKMPTAEFSLVFVDGQVWGIINEAVFTPKQETTNDFLSRQWHGIEALLRYKEDGSAISLVGKEKQKGLELYVLDLTDKEQRRTRYYVSAKSARVLWLEYEEAPSPGAVAVKFTRKFHDYHLAQGTLVPFRSVLYKDGNQIEETQISTITFGAKVNEALFKNPDAATSATASRP